jgi:hypothetical protein
MSVCCDCCVLSGRVMCDELITSPEKSYRLLCVVVCVETSWQKRLWPTGGFRAKSKKNRSKEIKTRSMFNNAKQLLGTRSVWQQPNPFACFPIQTNLGTFYLFHNAIPLSLSKPPREKNLLRNARSWHTSSIKAEEKFQGPK